MKEVEKLGYTNPSNPHQSGIVTSRGGYCPHSTQCSGETHQRPYGKLIVMGGIGYNERQDRDSKRVLDRQGCMFGLKAHISLEPPLVIRRYKYGDMENDRGI